MEVIMDNVLPAKNNNLDLKPATHVLWLLSTAAVTYWETIVFPNSRPEIASVWYELWKQQSYFDTDVGL